MPFERNRHELSNSSLSIDRGLGITNSSSFSSLIDALTSTTTTTGSSQRLRRNSVFLAILGSLSCRFFGKQAKRRALTCALLSLAVVLPPKICASFVVRSSVSSARRDVYYYRRRHHRQHNYHHRRQTRLLSARARFILRLKIAIRYDRWYFRPIDQAGLTKPPRR